MKVFGRIVLAFGALYSTSVVAEEVNPAFVDREGLTDTPAVSAAVQAALVEGDTEEALTPEQEARLAQRVAALLAVRVGESSEEHELLLNSWGGEHWFPAGSVKGEYYRSLWLGPDHPKAIASMCVESPHIEFGANAPREELSTTHVITPERTFGACRCLFEFDPPTSSAIQLGTVWCDLYFPMVRNDGTKLDMGFRMIWSADHQEWLPGAILYAKPEGIGTTIQFF